MMSLKIFEFLCENIKRSINYLSLFNALSRLELYPPGNINRIQTFWSEKKFAKCIVLSNMAQNRRKILCRYSKLAGCQYYVILVVDARISSAYVVMLYAVISAPIVSSLRRCRGALFRSPARVTKDSPLVGRYL